MLVFNVAQEGGGEGGYGSEVVKLYSHLACVQKRHSAKVTRFFFFSFLHLKLKTRLVSNVLASV